VIGARIEEETVYALQDDPRLSDRQRTHLLELSELLAPGRCRLALSEDGTKVQFYGRDGRQLCSSPVSEFDY
jgi:hypothetical protein